MLFKKLDKLKRSSIMMTIVLMFIGNVLLIIPESYVPMMTEILAFLLLVVCVLTVFEFLDSGRTLMNYISLFFGLLAGLIGLICFIFDDFMLRVLSWLVGTVPVLLGIYGIFHALTFARRSGRRGWWILIVLSAALALFGGFVFFNPWSYSDLAVMQVLGGALMFSALVSALSLIWIWPVRSN